jgi:hypothetical protein
MWPKKHFKFSFPNLVIFLKEKKQEYCNKIFPLKLKKIILARFWVPKIKPLT